MTRTMELRREKNKVWGVFALATGMLLIGIIQVAHWVMDLTVNPTVANIRLDNLTLALQNPSFNIFFNAVIVFSAVLGMFVLLWGKIVDNIVNINWEKVAYIEERKINFLENTLLGVAVLFTTQFMISYFSVEREMLLYFWLIGGAMSIFVTMLAHTSWLCRRG